MASAVTVKWDKREFDRTFAKYRTLSKRAPETMVNTKGYFICRRATVETQKSTKVKIREDLMTAARIANAPIAAILVQVQRGKAGLPGLYGKGLQTAANALIKARRVATLAAGWIPAIKAFEPFAEKRGAPKQAKVEGDPESKGYGKPSRGANWKAKAIFANLNSAKWDTQGTAKMIAEPALEGAFAFEEQSMKDYIERKLKETAKEAGVKTK